MAPVEGLAPEADPIPCHRVLVVNHLPELRRIIASLLRRDQHEVVTASDAAEGLALLGSGPLPSAILVDFLAPEAGGALFVAQARRNPRWAQVPIVAMTGDRAGLGAEAAFARLRKPFRNAELREVLGRLGPRRQGLPRTATTTP